MNRKTNLLMLAGIVLLIFSSITMAEQIAPSFIYPVGNQNSPPTEQAGNANGFTIAQHFNTESTFIGINSPRGAWCGNNFVPTADTTQSSCESKGYKWIYGHTGDDLSNGSCGSVIKATANGKVEFSGNYPGYGNLLKIKHTLPNGRIVYSLYGHRASVEKSAGDDVLKGDIVGHVGSTGAGSNCHLHFVLYDETMTVKLPAGTIAPPGYVYNDKTGTTSSGTPITPNIIRYFYDPLLFVDDRNSEWWVTFGTTGYYGITFSTGKSIAARTMFVVNSAGVAKSLQSAVNAGWIGSNIYQQIGTSWYYTNSPIESNTLYSGNTYIFQALVPNLSLHGFIPGNNYLDGRWRGDMAEFTIVNASLGFGRALRETYTNNPNWDTTFGLVTMLYEQTVSGTTRNATVWIAYSKTDPQVRYVSYYNPFTAVNSAWVRVY